jgi:nucleotide-binding universal stress UspA family protein
MKRIIIPTDFSENAYNAISYALRLFEKEKCTFFLLNTFTPAAYYVGVSNINTYSALKMEEIASQNSKRELDAVEDRIKKEFNNQRHSFVKIAALNLLASEISSLVEEHDVDLVVMGTKGATGAKEIFIGTQTMYTIKKVKCPLIAVPSDFHYEAPKEILFATDFRFDNKNRNLPLLREIAHKNAARVNILNAYYGKPLSEEQEQNKDFINSYFTDTAHVFHTAEAVDVVDAVDKFQIKHKINFLVMVHNRHTFFENLLFRPVINQMAYHIHVPFLVIPSEELLKLSN